MSVAGSNRAVVAALLANLGIAVTKLVAWVFSGSAAMLAESVHSFADGANQLLLLVGVRRARKRATPQHPFGYGRERYVYAFVVAIVLFSLGGLYSIYEGVGKLQHPHTVAVAWLPLAVIVVGLVLEGFSLRTAVRESLPLKGEGSWLQFVRRSKAPELPIVLLEDFAALIGLLLAGFGVCLTWLTGNGVFDALATIAIGVLLVAVALVVGVEVKSLLVGEGASPAQLAAIERILLEVPEIERIVHSRTLYLGPGELLIAAKITLAPERRMREVSVVVNLAEERIRREIPEAHSIYIESDVFYDPEAAQPTTSSVILLSSD